MLHIDKISPVQKIRKYYTKNVRKLVENKIFCFSSNAPNYPEKKLLKNMEGDININDNPTCKLSLKIDDGDQYKVECKDCQRLVHYKCTHLPLYQLQLFLTTGYRKFVCINCVNGSEVSRGYGTRPIAESNEDHGRTHNSTKGDLKRNR